jgi:hypothetical protein
MDFGIQPLLSAFRFLLFPCDTLPQLTTDNLLSLINFRFPLFSEPAFPLDLTFKG